MLLMLFQAWGKFLFDSLIPGPRYEVRLMTSIIRKYEYELPPQSRDKVTVNSKGVGEFKLIFFCQLNISLTDHDVHGCYTYVELTCNI